MFIRTCYRFGLLLTWDHQRYTYWKQEAYRSRPGDLHADTCASVAHGEIYAGRMHD